MNINEQLQNLEQKCSKYWLQQIEQASKTEDVNEIEYASYSLLRFFRYLEESEIQRISVDEFYRQIILFIKKTNNINDINISNNIKFFRSVSHIVISDFIRGFDEISRISLDLDEGAQENDAFLFEKGDIICIKFACLAFFNRFDDALSIIQDINSGQIHIQDDLVFIDTQIRQSLILSKLSKNQESIKILMNIKDHQNINLYPLLSLRDIDFQIASLYFIDYVAHNDNSFKAGFDNLMVIASINPGIAFFQIAYTYALKNKYDKARAYILQIEEKYRNYKINLFLSFVLYKLNELSESYEILKDLLKYSQFSAPIYELIGLIFLKFGNFNQAIQFLHNAYILEETNKTYALNYGLSLEIQKETSEMAEQFYYKMMSTSYLWEVYANRSCILNLNQKQDNKKYFCRIVEPQLEEVVLSPAQDQVDRFLQAPPFFPSRFFSSLNEVDCKDVPISPIQKRIPLFPIETF